MENHTQKHRLDILQTRIKAIETTVINLSNPDKDGFPPFTVFERNHLWDLLCRLDEVQERMHSIFVEQDENVQYAYQEQLNADFERRTQENARLARLFRDVNDNA